jgi:hypothetical protein
MRNIVATTVELFQIVVMLINLPTGLQCFFVKCEQTTDFPVTPSCTIYMCICEAASERFLTVHLLAGFYVFDT